MPSMPDIPSTLDMNVALPVAGVALLAAIAAVATSGSSDNKSSTFQSSQRNKKRNGPDVSIPYDSAARQAYDAWCQAHDESFNEAAYAHFQTLYERQAIAQATWKKMCRDMEAFNNEPPKSPPPRQIREKKLPAVKEMFFAS